MSPTTTSTTPPQGSLPGWDSWTLIYASLETADYTSGDAEQVAAEVEGANVLLSDDYPSLNPGYWVVYAGSWGSRHEAGAWCPPSLGHGLTCYPRYLGDNVPQLLADGAALAELGNGLLVVMDPTTASVIATFDREFGGDGIFPSYFNLTADWKTLYFGVGFEDSWFWCEGEKGQIRALDLESGTEALIGDGRSPSISPDRRWLAIVAAEECFPDPEVGDWYMAPGSAVEVYDLTDGDYIADYVLRPSTPPTSYDDPNAVRRVMWDPATDGDLIVSLADGSARRTQFDSGEALDVSELFWTSEVGEFAVANATGRWLVEWDGEVTAVTVQARSDGDEIGFQEIDGWVTGFALGRSGEVIITTWEFLVLPSGERVRIDGGINNLAW